MLPFYFYFILLFMNNKQMYWFNFLCLTHSYLTHPPFCCSFCLSFLFHFNLITSTIFFIHIHLSLHSYPIIFSLTLPLSLTLSLSLFLPPFICLYAMTINLHHFSLKSIFFKIESSFFTLFLVTYFLLISQSY